MNANIYTMDDLSVGDLVKYLPQEIVRKMWEKAFEKKDFKALLYFSDYLSTPYYITVQKLTIKLELKYLFHQLVYECITRLLYTYLSISGRRIVIATWAHMRQKMRRGDAKEVARGSAVWKIISRLPRVAFGEVLTQSFTIT